MGFTIVILFSVYRPPITFFKKNGKFEVKNQERPGI